MRLFKTKWFVRYARQERLDDHSLCDAIERAERGLVDSELGGGIIKQRVARTGQGRSGGYRLLIAYHSGKRAVFLYGFAKNEKSNITSTELAVLGTIAKHFVEATDAELEMLITNNSLIEIDEVHTHE